MRSPSISSLPSVFTYSGFRPFFKKLSIEKARISLFPYKDSFNLPSLWSKEHHHVSHLHVYPFHMCLLSACSMPGVRHRYIPAHLLNLPQVPLLSLEPVLFDQLSVWEVQLESLFKPAWDPSESSCDAIAALRAWPPMCRSGIWADSCAVILAWYHRPAFLFMWSSGDARSRFSLGCEGWTALGRDVSYKMSFTISLSQT